MIPRPFHVVAVTLLATAAAAGGTAPVRIVACAPGYPGSTEQAQPTMDAFAAAVDRAAGWDGRVAAVYHESLDGGLAALEAPDSSAALVPLALYLEARERLGLRVLLEAEQASARHERWSLVARSGAVPDAAGLAGWTIEGMPCHSPEFVRRVALADAALPADVAFRFSSRIASSLRRAAGEERVAVLLDHAQAEALGTLRLAAPMSVLARSEPLPAHLLCTVGERLAAGDRERLARALLGLGESEAGRAALEGLRVARFHPADAAALERIERRFAGAGPR